MFVSAIIPLTPLNTPAPQPNRFHGRAAHALFLDLVRRADAELADKLHEPRGDKPFTVSGVLPHSYPRTLSPSPVGAGSPRPGRHDVAPTGAGSPRPGRHDVAPTGEGVRYAW